MSRVALFLLGILIAALFAALVVRAVEWNVVRDVLARAEPAWLVLALAALACDFALRIERWRRMLARRGIRASFGSVASPLLSGFALNNVLPLRAGDIARTFMAKSALGAPLSVGVGSVLVERIFDLVVLVAALGLGTWAIAQTSLPVPIAVTATVIAGAAIVALIACALFGETLASWIEAIGQRLGSVPRVFRFASSLLETLAALSGPRSIALLTVLSVLVWVFEGLVILCCAWALGLPISPLGAALVLAGANLATLLPGAPGHFGTYHFFAMTAVGALAVDHNSGAALAILAHALIWLPITVVGGSLAIGTISLRMVFGRALDPHSVDSESSGG